MVSLPPLTWVRVFTRWQASPGVLALAALALVGYVCAVQALNARHPHRRWPRWRTVAFTAGVAVVVAAVCGSPGAYGEVLFSMHMVRHLMLIMLAPWLLALGYPVTLLLRVTRGPAHRRVRAVLRSTPVAVLTHPLVTLGAYLVVVAAVHLSGFMQAAMEHPALAWVEGGAYLVAGYLFFSQTLSGEPSRWDVAYPAKLFAQFVAMMADTVVGVVLLQYASVPWPAYAQPHREWGPPPLADLHAGAAVMWIAGDGLMLLMMVVLAARWLSDPRPQAATAGRWLESARRAALAETGGQHGGAAGAVTERDAIAGSADVDADEAALAAYNAMLARLDQRQPGRDRGRA